MDDLDSRPKQRRGWTRRRFLRRAGVGLGAVLAAGAGVGGYGHFVEPRLLEVTSVPVWVRGLPEAFRGTTIALLTDLHIATAPDRGYLESVVDRVLDLSPSLIALGGDYVQTRAAWEREVLHALVSRLRAPLGVYAILGNHDHWTEVESVIDALAGAGASLLRNSSAEIRLGGQRIHLAGVDDIWEGLHDLGAALKGVPPEECALLLAHEPDFADEAGQGGRVALQLSGHSHAGQVRIPGLPRILPRHGQKYPEGLRQVGSLRLYTSRGLGSISLSVRLNCPPELPVLELLPEG